MVVLVLVVYLACFWCDSFLFVCLLVLFLVYLIYLCTCVVVVVVVLVTCFLFYLISLECVRFVRSFTWLAFGVFVCLGG